MLNKIHNKIRWSGYVGATLVRWRVWNALYSPTTQARLEQSRLFLATLPPFLQPSDPMFTHPAVLREFLEERTEYLYHFRHPVYLEPEAGYAIAEPYSLLYAALPECDMASQPAKMHFFSAVPSLRRYRAARMGRLPVREEETIISLRHLFNSNYYHFIQDLMTQLMLLDEQGIDPAIPIVISNRLANARFFQEFRQRGQLAQRNWIVQDGFYIKAQEIIFAKSDRGIRSRLEYFLNAVETPLADPTKSRRIFLTRETRNLVNLEKLRPCLEAHRFEIVDTGKMLVSQQMKLFGEAGIIVGTHGAGLTNLIYRRGAPARLLEIFAATEAPLHYYVLAKVFGLSYDCLFGEQPSDRSRGASFSVNVLTFQEALARICSS